MNLDTLESEVILMRKLLILGSISLLCLHQAPVLYADTKATGSETFADENSVVGLWKDLTKETIGTTEEYSNSLEPADINDDGLVDILFANGGGYEEPGEPEFSRIFLNQGAGQKFKEATQEILGPTPMVAARAIRVVDVNGDNNPDIAVGTSYQTQSRLYLGLGAGQFNNVTKSHLPQIRASVGDLKFGDVDSDGDLDLVLANWGPGNPMKNAGGYTMLWLNDGSGHFKDVTDSHMPKVPVQFSWNLEFIDLDNDYDLDIMVSAKISRGSFLLENDGNGIFKDVTKGRVPEYTNNYEIEAMELNADGYMDIITMNDDEYLEDGPYARRNHIFINNREGGFQNASPLLWQNRYNPAVDDNLAVMLDYDSDGDPDALVGSLAGPDRVLINNGTGHLQLHTDFLNSFTGDPTHGTLGMGAADLKLDGKIDIVQSQGEVPGHIDEWIYFGEKIKPDTVPPVITLVEQAGLSKKPVLVRARIHDNKSPVSPHDFKAVMLYWTPRAKLTAPREIPMRWYGAYLWRGEIDTTESFDYQLCAIDAVGNKSCSLEMTAK